MSEIFQQLYEHRRHYRSVPLFLSDAQFQSYLEDSIAVQTFLFVNHFDLQLAELRELLHRDVDDSGAYVFFPWENCIYRILTKDAYELLHTARNRNLISLEEQQRFRSFRVGIAGLSVGSNVATALVRHGGGGTVSLIDPDVLMLSNLNRVAVTLADLGDYKASAVARLLYGVNPYIRVHCRLERLSKQNLSSFFDHPRLDLVVDEVDDLRAKILIRLFAKRRRVPVVMVTDNGDDVILDVERYDYETHHPLFHGILSATELRSVLHGEMTRERYLQFGTRLVGQDNISSRMAASLRVLGSELQSVPQLATGATVGGAVAVHAIRNIALGYDVRSYRRIIQS